MVKDLKGLIYPGNRVQVENHRCGQTFTATVEGISSTFISWKRDGADGVTEWRQPRACNVVPLGGGAVRVFLPEDDSLFLTIRPVG
jgi:hypothetical protein